MSSTTVDPLLSNLTPEQREAVEHFEGPLLILAGAGSGKTRVITRRVAHLLRSRVPAHQILAITFTNKAADEMKRRVAELVQSHRVWISTFHSLGVRLLRQYAERFGIDRNFTIYDQSDRLRMVKNAIESANLAKLRFTPETIQATISKAKNQLQTPDLYAKGAKDFFTTTVATVFAAYERKMRDANAFDYDDLLLWPALAMKNDPELRAELDARFRYVLIDEYQDTNKAQYALVRGLSVDEPNLCVVGDPDQSIYKFRGSDIRNIMDFERDFPNARVITLSRNYRSTKAILHAAGQVIARNKNRKPKELYTDNDEGRPVTELFFETGLEEANGIAQRIRKEVREGRRRYGDFAVFLRINALSRGLETAFVKNQVPFQIVRGLAFFDRKENRDLLAYLRLMVNPRDDVSFMRAVNEPARGIGKVSLAHLRKYAEDREIPMLEAAAQVENIENIRGKATKGLREFVDLMKSLREHADAMPEEVIRQVLTQSGYHEMLKSSGDPQDEERLANIEEVITAAKQFVEEDSERTLADFLENITLASDVDGWDDAQNTVSVMTLHAAKGLEFPAVFMAAVEQGILPHERSLSKNEEVEEERRLAFVGMTRAKEELYLCHSRMREFRGQTLYAVPSMFLDELPTENVERVDMSSAWNRKQFAPEPQRSNKPARPNNWRKDGVEIDLPSPSSGDYSLGMTVLHEKYGLGKITRVSGTGSSQKVKIKFKTAGERSFVANKAKLTIVGKK